MARDIIIGAGLAGLSAGISLLDKGREVLLFEASEKLTVKTCGEFLSYESLALLEKWKIFPKFTIHKAHFHYNHRSIVFELPSPCGSMPRLDLENTLLDLFIKKGGKVQFGTKADPASFPGESVIISAGRWQGKPPTSPHYIGIKNHFSMTPPSDLHMFFSKDSYFGISPLTEGKVVFSCLAKPMQHPEQFIRDKIQDILLLQDAVPSLPSWLITPVGALGMKKLPDWPNVYFLGDARATIAPLSGGGMTMALTSGEMAAEFIVQGKWQEFQKAWHHRYARRIQLAKTLNSLVFRPSLLPLLFKLLQAYPELIQKFFTWTRDE